MVRLAKHPRTRGAQDLYAALGWRYFCTHTHSRQVGVHDIHRQVSVRTTQLGALTVLASGTVVHNCFSKGLLPRVHAILATVRARKWLGRDTLACDDLPR